jgi:hypothetical protein
MEVASPARLYASTVGALLLVLGIAGFFYSASFGAPGTVEEALGVLEVNAWLNLLHVATGALGLLAASYAARPFALAVGLFYTALAIWGLTLGDGEAILGFIPTSGGDDVLHLIVGLAGLAAAAGTPRTRSAKDRRGARPQKASARRSEARADAAGEGA